MNTCYKKRIAVIRGGPSSEYEFSMQTGCGVINALSATGFDVKDIVISRSGEWLVHGFVRTPERALMDVDGAFIALHGLYGEDGTIQRILERLCIPYNGSAAYASAIAMNKALTKDFLKKNSTTVKLAPHMKLSRSSGANLAQLSRTITDMFGPEYVIKPSTGGSSVGTLMATAATLLSSIAAALEHHDEIIVEKRIRGKEATVGILEHFRQKTHYQLPVIEIVPPASSDFFSSDVKYNGETEEICPGRFSKSQKQELSAQAQEVHTLLGLRQYSRSDFIVADDGIYFLEVNTLPGLTDQSLYPKAAEAVGCSYNELVSHLIATI